MLKNLRLRTESEEGISLIVVILMMTIIAGFISLMTIMAMASFKHSSNVRDLTYFDLATNTAVSNALTLANNSTMTQNVKNHVGPTNAVKGTLEGDTEVNWQWYAKPIASSVTGLSYDIVATGYRGDPNDPVASRTVTARLVSFPTDGARKIDDSVFYRPTKASVFSWGIFGGDGVTVAGNTKVASFDSANGSTGTTASLGSNENIVVASTANVPNVSLMNSFSNHTTAERCTGVPCAPPRATELTYGMDTSVVTEWVADACTGQPAPDVTGSTIAVNGGAVNCYNNVTLSGNVTITNGGTTVSTGNPGIMYIKGDLTIEPGTVFNAAGGNSAVSGGMVYRMYIDGANVRIGSTGATGTATDFRALVAASRATCTVGAPAATTSTWGALVCARIVATGNTTMNWDEQTAQITGDAGEPKRIWNITGFSNGK